MGRVSLERISDDGLSTGGVFAVLPCRPLSGLSPLRTRLVAAAHPDKEKDAGDGAADPMTDTVGNITGATFENPGNKIGIVSRASC